MTTALILEVGQRVESLAYGQGIVIEANNIPDGIFDEWGDADSSHWKIEFDEEHVDLERENWSVSDTPRRYRWFNENDLCPDGVYLDPRDSDNQNWLQEYWGEEYWMNSSLFLVGPKPKRTSGFGKFVTRIEGSDD